MIALEEGAIADDHIVGEIGEVLAGEIDGRRDPEEITLFESLGIAAQDLVSAQHVLTRAEAEDVGVVVELGGLRDA